jgi:predicted transcriptional regulator
MANVKKFDSEKRVSLIDDEDEATLAAIDEGIADAIAGRTFSISGVRKLIPKWITDSSSRKDR